MRLNSGSTHLTSKSMSPSESGTPVAGRTPIAALVAGLTLGLVVVGFSAAFATGFRVVQVMREKLQAAEIITHRAESLRLYSWSQLANASRDGRPLFVEGQGAAASKDAFHGAQYAVHVADPVPFAAESASAARAHLRSVTLTMYRTNYPGAQANVQQSQVQTRLARNGAPKYVWPTL
jgi:hypothetical protein